VILPALHYGRDSLAGIIITLQNLLEHGGTLSTLRRDLPGYEIVKKKGGLPDGVGASELLERIARQESAGARVTTDDGVKLDYESSWVHLRASNTEPIVRVIAEAKSRDEAENLAERFLRMLSGA
jgi:phosphomannomutase